MDQLETFSKLLKTEAKLPPGELLGYSREALPIYGFRFGNGPLKISLVAGAHADEPVGPLLLEKLVTFLAENPDAKQLLADYSWFIIPHANPDGRERNSSWQETPEDHFDLITYLKSVVRESPGDDIEFGYPHDEFDTNCRPENLAIYNWWIKHQPFDLHGSLHGMGFAAGPWFLLDRGWATKSIQLIANCQEEVRKKGYRLHDVDRGGEKGFFRLAEGFSSCPNSVAMREFFLAQNDLETAELFRPNSMETIKKLNPNAITFVTELPLFLLPQSTKNAPLFKEQLAAWAKDLSSNNPSPSTIEAIAACGIAPMKIEDQLYFQWFYLCSCIDLFETVAN